MGQSKKNSWAKRKLDAHNEHIRIIDEKILELQILAKQKEKDEKATIKKAGKAEAALKKEVDKSLGKK